MAAELVLLGDDQPVGCSCSDLSLGGACLRGPLEVSLEGLMFVVFRAGPGALALPAHIVAAKLLLDEGATELHIGFGELSDAERERLRQLVESFTTGPEPAA